MPEQQNTGEGKRPINLLWFGPFRIATCIATLAGTFTLGPVDFPRTAYNAVIGDGPRLRAQIVEYIREGVALRDPSLEQGGVEAIVARELGVPHTGGKIEADEATMSRLWDASEKYAHSIGGKYFWPSLGSD